jgi:hypothetical protein
MDPYAVLEVEPGATPDEITASYRSLAKRWHPDRGGGAQAEARMAEINSAYDLLRSEVWHAEHGERPVAPAAPARPAGHWLSGAMRRALGPELVRALQRDEPVRAITPTSVWASPEALLAVTDHRLLWLLDDAVTNRVRSLDFRAITGVETRLSWPRRRTASLRVTRRSGRPLSFGELRPDTARAISSLIRGAAVAA